MDGLAAQLNIRNNARDMHDCFQELYKWERSARDTDAQLERGSKPEQDPKPARGGCRGRAAPVAAPSDPHLTKPSPRLMAGAAAGTSSGSAPRGKRESAGKGDSDGRPADPTVDSSPSTSEQGEAMAGIRQPRPPDEEARVWREKGNEHFKLGNHGRAKDCYSRSIAAAPSASALANRAMACIKLRQWEQAEADCTEAVGLDPGYLKAWQRRARVHRSTGKLESALADLDTALRLAPTSAAISSELREVLALHAQAQQLTPAQESREVRLKVSDDGAAAAAGDEAWDTLTGDEAGAGARAVDGAAAAPATWRATQSGEGGGDASGSGSWVDLGADGGGMHGGTEAGGDGNGRPSVGGGGEGSAGDTKAGRGGSRVDEAAMAATLRQVQGAIPLQAKRAPRTSTEFETAWKGLRDSGNEREQYLLLLEPEGLKGLFQCSLTPGLLEGIVNTILTRLLRSDDPARRTFGVRLLANLVNVERFGMNTMLIPRAARATLTAAWDELLTLEAAADVHHALADVRDKYKL